MRRPRVIVITAAPEPHTMFAAISTDSGGTRWSKMASAYAVRSSPGPDISRRVNVGDVTPGHLLAPELPTFILRRCRFQVVGHLRLENRSGHIRDTMSVEKQVHLEFHVLRQMPRPPTPVHELAIERHPIAVETAGCPDCRSTEWTEVVTASERSCAQCGSGRTIGIVNSVVALSCSCSSIERGRNVSQEIGTKRRIGVNDQDGVELHSGCLQPVVEPVERGTLAGLRRIDAHVDIEAATAHDVVGAIGAVIGNHVNLIMIRWIVEVPEAVQRAADDRLLVVRGHQDRKWRGIERAALARPVGETACTLPPP